MKHERAIADARTDAERVLDGRIAALPPCPGLPSSEAEIADADARGRADMAAGRCHPHEVVGQWLLTWGRDDFRPFEEWLAARDG